MRTFTSYGVTWIPLSEYNIKLAENSMMSSRIAALETEVTYLKKILEEKSKSASIPIISDEERKKVIDTINSEVTKIGEHIRTQVGDKLVSKLFNLGKKDS